jgi:hypothetical protein
MLDLKIPVTQCSLHRRNGGVTLANQCGQSLDVVEQLGVGLHAENYNAALHSMHAKVL